MIPAIIHQIWLNQPRDRDAVIWGNALESMNPEFDHKVWALYDIEELGFDPIRLPFKNPVWNSDIIRLEAVRQHGGIYLDCDIEPLKPIDVLLNHKAFSVRQRDGHINNAVFGAEPNHPWIEWQLAHVNEYIPKAREWAVYLMSDAPRDGVDLIEPHLVYPFWFDSPPEERKPHPDSLLVHHWKKSWMTL